MKTNGNEPRFVHLAGALFGGLGSILASKRSPHQSSIAYPVASCLAHSIASQSSSQERPSQSLKCHRARWCRRDNLPQVESWRELQSNNIEFTMRQLQEPIGGGSSQSAN
jgi:hypothetical protein